MDDSWTAVRLARVRDDVDGLGKRIVQLEVEIDALADSIINIQDQGNTILKYLMEIRKANLEVGK